MDTVPVLTIDGPSGAGKGTISRLVAKQLGWHYLDSGAIYRALAIAVQQRGIDLACVDEIAELGLAMRLHFDCDLQRHAQLDGEDITDLLPLETTGQMASMIASEPNIRLALLQKQHDFRQRPGLVADGRDMGTVVFPQANYKVFLTASAQTRALRRYKQLKEKGITANLAQITADIEERDQRDSQREIAPLMPAPDARHIDSSHMSIQAVVEEVLSLVR